MSEELLACRKVIGIMADALDVADNVIAVNMGTDTPSEWNQAFRKVTKARAALTRPAPQITEPVGVEVVIHTLIDAARMYEACCRLDDKDQEAASLKLDEAKTAALAALSAQPQPAVDVEAIESALTLELSRQSVSAGFTLAGINPRSLAHAALAAMSRPVADVERVRDLELALDLALAMLGKQEPGDSRAVSSEFVAMACIRCEQGNLEGCRTTIKNALSSLQEVPGAEAGG